MNLGHGVNDLADTPPPRRTHLRTGGAGGADEIAAGLISSQVAAIDRERPAVIIDLANGSPWTTRQRWRPGEHRSEAEAALSLWEDACDEPGGELKAWGCAVSALIHALLDIGERL
jgi:hypothetical protein